MSAFIGEVRGPNHNSPDVAAEVWCSSKGVEVVFNESRIPMFLDPIAARNLAALLVRAAEETACMRALDGSTPLNGGFQEEVKK